MNDLAEGLQRLFALIIQQTSTLRYAGRDGRHLLAMSLHGTILEYMAGAITLIQKSQSAAVFPVCRSLLEAYVDLANLVASPDYFRTIHAIHVMQRINFIQSILDSNDKNPFFLATGYNKDELIAELRTYRKEQNSLPKNGLSIKERFKLAGMLYQYDSMYTVLSFDVHNDLSALENRHANAKDGNVELYYFRPVGRDMILPAIETIAVFSVNSLKQVRILLGREDDTEVQPIEDALEALRIMYDVA